MRKKYPIGISDYASLQTRNYYVVDKTLMIQEYLERGSAVTLITRPRRFGKTSNMSMMSEFFDINKKSEEVFENTKIAETEYYKEMNQYPVVFLSFAAAKGRCDDLVKVIKEQIAIAYQKYSHVMENMNEYEKPFYDAIRNSINQPEDGSLKGLGSSIQFLTKKLEQYYKKKVMVFIDEYDTPFIEAHVQGYYDDIKIDLSNLLQSALKDNDALEYAMLTGIQRVSKENIFSHLNNIKVYTVKDKAYAQYFGFTKEETQALLEYYGLQLNDDVKAMYDGYNMGGIDIYNPWSIINYAEQQELIPYWVNTSSNTMMKDAMKTCDSSFKNDYEKLIKEGSLDVQTNLTTSFYEVRDNSNLWGLFVNAGYLTIDYELRLNRFHLRIPNHEVREEFANLTAAYLGVENSALNGMFAALEDKRREDFFIQYQYILLDLPSYHDLKGENSYHMMMLGMCAILRNDYDILSNREVGNGRCDIILQAKRTELPSYIIEFKYSKTKTNLTDLANQAIEQIKSRQYDFNLEGEVIYVGLAHHGKEVEMNWEVQ